jgi:hypothetical protein
MYLTKRTSALDHVEITISGVIVRIYLTRDELAIDAPREVQIKKILKQTEEKNFNK